MASWIIESLGQRHDRKDFDCGTPALSDWIKRYAGQNEARDISRTYVATRPQESRVYGYYTLLSCQIRFEELPREQSKKLPRGQTIPAALLGKLAVDLSCQGQGLGSVLLVDALGRAERLAKEIGMHAVVVDALDDNARSFYVKFGFEELLDSPRHLFMPFKVIRRLGIRLQG